MPDFMSSFQVTVGGTSQIFSNLDSPNSLQALADRRATAGSTDNNPGGRKLSDHVRAIIEVWAEDHCFSSTTTALQNWLAQFTGPSEICEVTLVGSEPAAVV